MPVRRRHMNIESHKIIEIQILCKFEWFLRFSNARIIYEPPYIKKHFFFHFLQRIEKLQNLQYIHF